MNLKELLIQRRSYRKFDASKKLSQEDIEAILQSISYASSANNRQYLRFLSIEDDKKVQEVFNITKWGASLPNNMGQPKEGEEPVYFVAPLYDPKQVMKFNGIDQGLVISNMTLTAYERGIGSCIIGNFNHKKLREILPIDPSMECDVLIAFGYPAIESTLKDISLDQDQSYYLDEKGEYIVPKYKFQEIVTKI
ncbi:MAG: nitroreductase family protein [Tissierellia bacterium]|nr:nitroreductase family protein [Tissierellia bacterium]